MTSAGGMCARSPRAVTLPTVQHRALRVRVPCCCSSSSSSSLNSIGDQEEKDALLEQLSRIGRGGSGFQVSSRERGAIEESIVKLERAHTQYCLDTPDYHFGENLNGRWKLLWTTAADVLPLTATDSTALFPQLVGDISQAFRGTRAGGSVFNVIEGALPPIADRIQAVVVAKYSCGGENGRVLRLQFQEARVGRLTLSDLGEFLAAPPLLQARGQSIFDSVASLRASELVFPLRELGLPYVRSEPSNRVTTDGDDETLDDSDSFSFLSDLDIDRLSQDLEATRTTTTPPSSGPGYLLTFLDRDLLIGKQTDSPGQFVFRKA